MLCSKNIIFLNKYAFILAIIFFIFQNLALILLAIYFCSFLGGFIVALGLLHYMVLLCSLSLSCLLKCTGKNFLVHPLSLIELSFARKSVVSFHALHWLPAALPLDCSHSLARSPSSLQGGDQTSTTGIL